MRSIPLTLCAVAVVAVTLVPAPAALAEPDPVTARRAGSGPGTASRAGPDGGSGASLSVTPRSAAPGSEVALRLDGCAGGSAEGSSDVFVSKARFAPAADGGLFARARIGAEASPGDHGVQAVCADGGERATGTVTVTVAGRDAAATPLAPVRAGGGGTATLSDEEARPSGPGIAHAVIGLALAAGAVVAVVFRGAARRRRPAAD
ncbi:hypothetical protein ACFW5D_08930 [Streptomyces sp. NPDC058770]|uniref:hypothetical protein n=1 Tax=Streptomyces sp. NPDC058770 TaxID=3346631 RepID=UPI00367EBFD0